MEIPVEDSSVPSGPSRARERWLLGLALVLTVAIWSVAVWFAADYLGCGGFEYVLNNLRGTMESSDAVVEGEATFLRSVEPEHCSHYEVYSLEIAEVHFVADVKLSDIPELAYQIPDLQDGDVIEIALGLRLDDAGTTPALTAAHTTFVVGSAVERSSPQLPMWDANVVADEDEILQGWLEGEWAAMDVGPPTAESLAAWMEEIRTVEAGGVPGPFETAYAASLVRPSRAQQWLEIDPKVRDLTAEDVPEELRDEFVDVMIFAELPKDLRGSEDERVVSLRSPSGVVWQASIAAGPHPLPVLAMPGEAWEVVELDGTGVDGTTIGQVPEQVWRDGYAVLLSIEERDGRLHATATPIDSAEFTARMEAIADLPAPGGVGPEPGD